ncbi:MAG: hypothetical protein LBF15_04645 [Candidatus Peribacteria bacterium]|jgi:hypothetical protein|nr:hypothetical protein [Candidatus Peribacteria bacterium]
MSLPNFMNIVSIKSSEGTLTYSMNGDILNVEVIGGDYNNGYNAKQETKTATYNQTTSSYTAAHQSVTYEAINSNPNYAATSTAATCKSWTQTTISLGYECVEPSRLNVNLAACANLSFNSTTGLFSHPYGMGCNQTYECFACWASASNTNCGSGFGCF